MWNVINVVIWTTVGVSTLVMSIIFKEDIPRLIYGLTWFCLMLELVVDCMSSVAQ